MISNLWIDTRKDNWNRLDALTTRVETDGVKSLGREDLRDFGLLYRQAAADLSAARSDGAARTLEQYLNRLVGRAHNFVYSGRKLGVRTLWDFFAHGYPRLLRRLRVYVVLSVSLFMAGVLLGTVITVAVPRFQAAYLGPLMMEKIEHQQMWTDRVLIQKPQESTFLMTHNLTVCLMTFAGGITAGLYTIFQLVNNGFLLGVIAVSTKQHHMALKLWSFVAAHSSVELPSIFLSGAAGLRLAAGFLFRGCCGGGRPLRWAAARPCSCWRGRFRC